MNRLILAALALLFVACESEPAPTLVPTLALPTGETLIPASPEIGATSTLAPLETTPAPLPTDTPTRTPTPRATAWDCDTELLHEYEAYFEEAAPVLERLLEAESSEDVVVELVELYRLKDLAGGLPAPCDEAALYRRVIVKELEALIEFTEALQAGDPTPAQSATEIMDSMRPLQLQAFDIFLQRIGATEGTGASPP